MAYCPDCVSFNTECHIDPDDYSVDCPYFQFHDPDKEWDDPEIEGIEEDAKLPVLRG